MNKEDFWGNVLAIAAFGSIWGCLETVTIGCLLHSELWGRLFPYHLCPCFVMTAVIGCFVMGSALAAPMKAYLLLGIGLAAAALLWLAVPFLPTHDRSTFYAPIVASTIAATSGSLAVALVASFMKRRLERSTRVRIGVGVVSALLASTLFIITTSYAFDKAICSDMGYGRALPDFLGIGGIVWMAAAAIFLPLGYLAGAKLRLWFASRQAVKASVPDVPVELHDAF